jgi:L-ascorbate metabolism protein UlaG (beta-lactamase superfamily)
MELSNIEVNTQSSIKMIFDKIIYFDPFKIEDDKHDADIIFITHNHYDHMDSESINKIKNENTIIIAPKSMEEVIKKMEFKEYIFLKPDEEINIGSINVKTIPAYNITKTFHPRENNWLGYIITYNNVSYYVAGDTDKTNENEKVKCDVALIPIGGHFTMDVNEAAELIKTINPQIVVPIHYGSVIGNPNDGKRLNELLLDTNIEVIEKIKF